MQFWPRKRARRQYARIRNWAGIDETRLLGFAGYKVGMTHISYIDGRKNSKTKGEEIFCPVTILECPPLKVIGYQAYTSDAYGKKAKTGGIFSATKELLKKVKAKKKEVKIDETKLGDIFDITLVVQTQPAITGIGKKKPEIFELPIGGNDIKAKIDYAKNTMGKDLRISEIFGEGQLVDIHGITKGKGTQGPVKRFGVKILQHKAEKTKRGVATMGPWRPHHGNYRVPQAGKMGWHQRTQLNKWVMRISDNVEKINPAGGWHNYGIIKNEYLLLKGSLDGPKKRLVRLSMPRRTIKKLQETPPEIKHISLKQ